MCTRCVRAEMRPLSDAANVEEADEGWTMDELAADGRNVDLCGGGV